MSEPEFRVLATPAEVARAAVIDLVAAASEAIAARGGFVVALSGGRTPHAAFHLLRQPGLRDTVDWARVEVLWGDERPVHESDPASNAGEARRTILDHLPGLRPEAIHPMNGAADDLDAAARAYEAVLRRVAPADSAGIPVIDLIWLGMGADGHTASLCPGSTALDETERLVVAAWAPIFAATRLTLTYPVLNAAHAVTFLVIGADKADAVARVRSGDETLPATRVKAASTTWLLDDAAAGGLW